MSTEDEHNTIDALLAKLLAGEASPEEAILANDWINATEGNRLRYEEFEKIWSLGSNKRIDVLNKEQTKAAITNSVVPKTKAIQWPYRIAAGVVLVIGVTISLYYLLPGKKVDTWSIKETSNEVASLSLPDGSSVTVNRNSRIQWPEDKGSGVRKVRMNGEAFFDVSHNPVRPFLVTIDEVTIKVLGTAFNVSNTSSEKIETEVMRGKVMMYDAQSNVIIEAGMKGVYDKKTKTMRLEKLEDENNVAYATHVLSFESITLKEVCEHLGKTYGVQFSFENKKVEGCTLTSAYSNKSLSFIMNVISESLGITYQIKGDSVYISGDGCL